MLFHNMSAILAAILDFSKILLSEIPTPGDEKNGRFHQD